MGEVKLTISTNVQELINKVDQLGDSTEKLQQANEEYAQRSKTSFMSTKQATELVDKAIKKLEGDLKKLTTEQINLAANQSKWGSAEKKRWEQVNSEIEITRRNISNLKQNQNDLGTSASKSSAIFTRLSTIIAGAFSVGAIINFGKAAVQAWDEQEKANTKLLVALKGNEEIQRRLITQANQMQQTTLYSDEEIINAQAMLASLTKDEETIRKLTPLVADLAQAKGMDLASAADLVAKSVGSSTNALKRQGIEIEGAVGSSERLESAITNLTKAFGGQAEAAATSGAGGIRQVGKAWGELLESFGSGAGRMAGVLKWLSDFVYQLSYAFKTVEQIKQESMDETLVAAMIGDKKEIQDISNSLQKSGMRIADANKRATELQIESLTNSMNHYEANSDMVKQLTSRIAELNKVVKINTIDTEENAAAEEKAKNAKEEAKKLEESLMKAELERQNELQKTVLETAATFQKLIDDLETEVKIDIDPAANDQLTMTMEQYETVMELARQTTQGQRDEINKQIAALQEWANTGVISAEQYQEAMAKLQGQLEELTSFSDKHPIAAALGFESEEQLNQIKEYIGQIMSFVNEMVAQQIEASNRLIDDYNQRIDEQVELVGQENEARKEGLANNYANEKENLQKMQQARDEAIRDREKQVKIQRTLSTIESSIALISATANIIKGFSSIPIVGVALGIIAVGAMIAGFVAAQSKVKDATKMERGGVAHYGLLKGRRHSDGGIPIEAEEGEFFVNRDSTAKYRPLLEAINRDDKLFFNRNFLNRMPQPGQRFDIDSSKRLGEIVNELRKGKSEYTYGPGYIIERRKGFMKRINLN